jgi:hypothetical protein
MGKLRKEKMKNDFGSINFGEEKGSGDEIEVDPFIASFCNHSVGSTNSQSTSQVSASSFNSFANGNPERRKEVKPGKHRRNQEKKETGSNN